MIHRVCHRGEEKKTVEGAKKLVYTHDLMSFFSLFKKDKFNKANFFIRDSHMMGIKNILLLSQLFLENPKMIFLGLEKYFTTIHTKEKKLKFHFESLYALFTKQQCL